MSRAATPERARSSGALRVTLVGPGQHFLSGITCYTFALANALAREVELSTLLMRKLLPAFLYPGSERVGQPLSRATLPRDVRVLDGVDYYWIPSMLRAARFLRSEDPDVVLLQWWSGTVLHTYLALALLARRRGARIVLEFHETLDPGEQNRPIFSAYVRWLCPFLFSMADRFVVHSEFDRGAVCERFGLDPRDVDVIAHAAYAQYRRDDAPVVDDGDDRFHLLYFGLIRPVKGLEYLVDAFDRLPDEIADAYRLTIAGETWEDWHLPLHKAAASPRRAAIDIANRYVHDDEVHSFFARADAVVLPYTRSSQSGVLHIAMAYGLPVVATNVGGIPEALANYGPKVLVPPRDPDALRDALLAVRDIQPLGRASGPTWEESAAALHRLCRAVANPSSVSTRETADRERHAVSA